MKKFKSIVKKYKLVAVALYLVTVLGFSAVTVNFFKYSVHADETDTPILEDYTGNYFEDRPLETFTYPVTTSDPERVKTTTTMNLTAEQEDKLRNLRLPVYLEGELRTFPAWEPGYSRWDLAVAKYLGLIDEDDYRRLTIEDVREIIATKDSYEAIMQAILKIQPYCDRFFPSNSTLRVYFYLNEVGTEYLYIIPISGMIYYHNGIYYDDADISTGGFPSMELLYDWRVNQR